MDNELKFPALDKAALMAAALSPVLNQWVADTVAFHQARLKLVSVLEPDQPIMSSDECRRLAEGFRDLLLNHVRQNLFRVSVPFDPKVLAPFGALSSFPLESLQRLSELQSLGLLPGLHLVWPSELAHLDKWGVQSSRGRRIDSIQLPAPDQDDDWSTDADSDEPDDDGPSPTPTSARKRRGPGDKCAIS
jgi:hypothetical protein